MSFWAAVFAYLELAAVVVMSVPAFLIAMRAKHPEEGEELKLVWEERPFLKTMIVFAKWTSLLAIAMLVRMYFTDEEAPLGLALAAVVGAFYSVFIWTYARHPPLRLTERGCYSRMRFVPWRSIREFRFDDAFMQGPVLKVIDHSGKTVLRLGGWGAKSRPEILQEVRSVWADVPESS